MVETEKIAAEQGPAGQDSSNLEVEVVHALVANLQDTELVIMFLNHMEITADPVSGPICLQAV